MLRWRSMERLGSARLSSAVASVVISTLSRGNRMFADSGYLSGGKNWRVLQRRAAAAAAALGARPPSSTRAELKLLCSLSIRVHHRHTRSVLVGTDHCSRLEQYFTPSPQPDWPDSLSQFFHPDHPRRISSSLPPNGVDVHAAVVQHVAFV